MPLIRIEIIKGVRTPDEIKRLADTIHAVMLEKFNAPQGDRYQVITQHEPYEMIFEDTGLGIPRSEKLILVQIFQQGRQTEQKQNVYAALAERLESDCGLPKSDLVVSMSANTKEDWSFGLGRAQFLTGEL